MKKETLKDIIQWDVNSWSKALNHWDKTFDYGKNQIGLELGGREGGLSLWLALKNIQTICSDLVDVENTAKHLHKKYDVLNIISYEDIDATFIPYENKFDIIVFKSIIGGVGRNDNHKAQQKVFDEIFKALKPGGRLFFAENLIGSIFHQKLRKKYTNWGEAWRYVSIEEMHQFLKRFTSYEINTNGIVGTLGRNEKQRNFLSSVDEIILNKICPNNWKYIVYGSATK